MIYFNGWSSLGQTIATGFFSYMSLVLLVRISGKRTLAKMNAFDLIVTVALGSTLATVMTSKSVALAEGIATMALLISCQYIVAWLSVRSELARQITREEPTMLLYRGKFIHDAMHAQRVTESEVLQAVRSQGITDLNGCVAVLETNGSFSVLPSVESSSSRILDGLKKPQ